MLVSDIGDHSDEVLQGSSPMGVLVGIVAIWLGETDVVRQMTERWRRQCGFSPTAEAAEEFFIGDFRRDGR